jgi:hypothetical protein
MSQDITTNKYDSVIVPIQRNRESQELQVITMHNTDVPDEDDCSSYADLNKLYSDLYDFQMCDFCFMPTSTNYCSEDCYVAHTSGSGDKSS